MSTCPMPMRIPSIQNTRRVWLAYTAFVVLLSALCFTGTTELLLDTHDTETFRDHERIELNILFFFAISVLGLDIQSLIGYLKYKKNNQ